MECSSDWALVLAGGPSVAPTAPSRLDPTPAALLAAAGRAAPQSFCRAGLRRQERVSTDSKARRASSASPLPMARPRQGRVLEKQPSYRPRQQTGIRRKLSVGQRRRRKKSCRGSRTCYVRLVRAIERCAQHREQQTAAAHPERLLLG